MKALLLTLILVLNISCTEEEVAATGTLLGAFTLIYAMENQEQVGVHGDLYYRTRSCSSEYYYFTPGGYEYYPSDCFSNSAGSWVTFGGALATTVFLYRQK
jgi:hypothetical protein